MTQNVVRMIDHTLLKADATKEEIRKLVEEAKKYLFASVCVN
ncbi:2-deoxyribose-5-phosphate aldolase, partial [Neobacillus drentensis]